MNRTLLAIALLITTAAALASCSGWTVTTQPDNSNRPPVRISIGIVQNQVTPPRPGLEYGFSERLKEEIALDRRFELAPYGSGTRIDITLIDFDEPDLVRNFDNTKSEIASNAEARIRIHGKRGMREERVKAYQSYAPALEKDTRNDGLARLWRDLARKTLDAISPHEWGKGSQSAGE